MKTEPVLGKLRTEDEIRLMLGKLLERREKMSEGTIARRMYEERCIALMWTLNARSVPNLVMSKNTEDIKSSLY